MELFLAQNHAPMTHLPIAASLLAALAAVAAVFMDRKELTFMWVVLSIVCVLSSIPSILTGTAAAQGRLYIKEMPWVEDEPDNADIRLHQQLGLSGFAVSLVFVSLGVARLRGKKPNRFIVAVVAVALATLWGIGGHVGGRSLWSPETFPAYEHLLPENQTN